MFDQTGQWIDLETFDEFDDGLSALIDLWSSDAAQAVKESALAHFKDNLESAMLNWAENRAKSKKYAAIAQELAEFEVALQESAGAATQANTQATLDPRAPVPPARATKQA